MRRIFRNGKFGQKTTWCKCNFQTGMPQGSGCSPLALLDTCHSDTNPRSSRDPDAWLCQTSSGRFLPGCCRRSPGSPCGEGEKVWGILGKQFLGRKKHGFFIRWHFGGCVSLGWDVQSEETQNWGLMFGSVIAILLLLSVYYWISSPFYVSMWTNTQGSGGCGYQGSAIFRSEGVASLNPLVGIWTELATVHRWICLSFCPLIYHSAYHSVSLSF